MAALKVLRHALLRLLVLSLVALAGVHFYFVARIALMAVIAPESTAFERSEIYRITKTTGVLPWRQQWMPYAKISVNLQRAVIASEDASFTEHDGLDLEALEKAWEKMLWPSDALKKLLSNKLPRPPARARNHRLLWPRPLPPSQSKS